MYRYRNHRAAQTVPVPRGPLQHLALTLACNCLYSHPMKEDEPTTLVPDSQQLLKLARYRMPFGKYANQLLIDLPEPYVIWFAGKGFPDGELGHMLRMVHEIKVNGLEYLFEPLRKG